MHECNPWRQYYAAIVVSLGSFHSGAAIGWSNPASSQLQFLYTPLEITWIISIFAIGAFVGACTGGISLRTVGRKMTIIFLSGTAAVSWMGLALSEKSYLMLLLLRFIIGFTGGGFSVTCPVYIGEVASADRRGRLGSIVSNLLTLGVVVAFVIGIFSHWCWISYIGAGTQLILFVIMICHLPESPVFLDICNKQEQYAKVREWLGLCDCSKCETDPLKRSMFLFVGSIVPVFIFKDPKKKIKSALKPTDKVDKVEKHLEKKPSVAQLPYTKQEMVEKLKLKFNWLTGGGAVIRYESDPNLAVCVLDNAEPTNLLHDMTSRDLMLPLFILTSIMFIYEFSGVSIMSMTSTQIYIQMGDMLPLDPNIATLISVGLVQLVNSFVAGIIVDKLGRRVLLLTGGTFMGITLLMISVFFYLKGQGIEDGGVIWLALSGCFFYQIAFSLSFGPVTWIVFAEIFPNKYRGYASMVAACKWIFSFTAVSIYPHLTKLLSHQAVFGMMAGVAFFGAGLLMALLPETKGLQQHEIDELFKSKKKIKNEENLERL